MSRKETQRALTLESVKNKQITLKKAATLLGISYAQTKRLWLGFKTRGPTALISKKRGKRSNRAVSMEKRQEIAKLINEKYYDCKPLFISEKLEQRHDIKYSSEFIRELMIEYHLWVPKKGRKVIHQRRKRRECRGELVQMDASKHKWFEERGPTSHLHLLIDDATSEIVGAYFTEEETTEGYFKACLPYFEKEGLPVSFYNDKRGTFKVNQGNKRGDTQFGRAMKELGVKIIFAHSPQAKGRIERVFGTLQDRLVWEMRIANISTIEEANNFLPIYLKKHNQRFKVEPASTFNAHRPLNQIQSLKYILCRKEECKVTKNLELQYNKKTYQLKPPENLSACLRRAAIFAITTLNNELIFQYQGITIKHKVFEQHPQQPMPPTVDELLENWRDPPSVRRPDKNHPWKRNKFSVNSLRRTS